MSEGNNSNKNENARSNNQNSSANNQMGKVNDNVEKNWNRESLQNTEEPEEEILDEEENENEAEDVKEAVKDGTSLAKNVATKNVAGIAKDAVKLAKNKTVRKKIVRNNIIQFLLPIIVIILLAGSILAIFSAVADTVQELISGAVDAIVDFFTVDDTSGEILVSDEQIDTIINSIEELGVSAEDLK